MSDQTKALRAFPSFDEPHDVRPLHVGGVGALIAGLNQARGDLETCVTEAAQILGYLADPSTLPPDLNGERFVRDRATEWCRRFGDFAVKQ